MKNVLCSIMELLFGKCITNQTVKMAKKNFHEWNEDTISSPNLESVWALQLKIRIETCDVTNWLQTKYLRRSDSKFLFRAIAAAENISSSCNSTIKMSFPYEIKPMEEAMKNELKANFIGETEGYLEAGPKKFIVTSRYAEFASTIYNFKVRPDDAWVVTFPRSGTTLMQELVWLIKNDLDFETASKVLLLDRSPQIEHITQITRKLQEKVEAEVRGDPVREAIASQVFVDPIPLLDAAPGSRTIKSHLPLSFLPPNLLDIGKVVYVCRSTKDVAVSFYHLGEQVRNLEYVGDFKTFWNYFENNKVWNAPYWDHIRDAWEKKDHPNMLFLFYEDIDMEGTIRKVAAHLNKQLTEAQLKKLAEHMHFDNFKKNTSVNLEPVLIAHCSKRKNQFIRKGKVGGWGDYFTPEMNARADKWIAENLARIPGFAFPK
ncbi:hypothetical protein B566_EDAN001587 [Ephemera danica]|nr:hypothetical protein B566_EDAN001587 [Ephemera danica]